MPDLGARIQGLFEFSSKVEAGVYIFGKLCLFAAVFLALKVGETLDQGLTKPMPELAVAFSEESSAKAVKANFSDFDIILKRNIFGAEPTAQTSQAAVPQTKLSLRLVGASLTDGENPFAIIENTQKNEQDVFELNESVFGQATLIGIEAQSVKLQRGGSVEVLLLEAGEGSSVPGEEPAVEASSDGSNFSISEEELNNELANLPRLLSQARAVPYFRNGASIGMRLFAIRKDSLYDKIGLLNGDILKDINGNSLSDPSQALKLFEILKNERSISVVIERAGEDKKLEYAIN